MRPRPAPTAARTAISRFLQAARTSKRLATLAQAISRTKLTAPKRIKRDERTSLDKGILKEFDGKAVLCTDPTGELAPKLAGGELKLCVCHRERHATLEPRHDVEVLGLVVAVGVNLERKHRSGGESSSVSKPG